MVEPSTFCTNKCMGSLENKKTLLVLLAFFISVFVILLIGNGSLSKYLPQQNYEPPQMRWYRLSLQQTQPPATQPPATQPPAEPTPSKPQQKSTIYADIMKSFLLFETGKTITKDNWKGQCPYPYWIPTNMQRQSWFQPYLQHLQRVDLSTSHYPLKKMRDCSRWWSATPQYIYDDPPEPGQPYRGKKHLDEWKPKPKPPPGYIRPKCQGFGRQLVPRTSCATKQEILWRTLDKLGIVYFPRAGTDLGVVRGSKYLTTDGDLDIHVDMPQKQLLYELSKVLSPTPYLSQYKGALWFKTEVHWRISGCPAVHMVFNDWMEDEMSHTKPSLRAGHLDICECLMNSVPLSCHKEAIYRTWLFYGPSWRVPLHAKALDVPHRGRHYNIKGKLESMLSWDGVIYEQTVRDLDKSIKYTDPEMKMILAQLNELQALITCQNDSKCRRKLTWYG